MNAVEFFVLIEELKPLMPSDVTSIGHDLEIFHRSDEAFLLLLEISLVGKRQVGFCPLQHLESELRRCLAFWMKMSARGAGPSWARVRLEDASLPYFAHTTIQQRKRNWNPLDLILINPPQSAGL